MAILLITSLYTKLRYALLLLLRSNLHPSESIVRIFIFVVAANNTYITNPYISSLSKGLWILRIIAMLIWVYISVILMFERRRISCMRIISTPSLSVWVAIVCFNDWTEAFFWIPVIARAWLRIFWTLLGEYC